MMLASLTGIRQTESVIVAQAPACGHGPPTCPQTHIPLDQGNLIKIIVLINIILSAHAIT